MLQLQRHVFEGNQEKPKFPRERLPQRGVSYHRSKGRDAAAEPHARAQASMVTPQLAQMFRSLGTANGTRVAPKASCSSSARRRAAPSPLRAAARWQQSAAAPPRARAARLIVRVSSSGDGETVIPQVAPLAPTSETGIQLRTLLAAGPSCAKNQFDLLLSAHLEIISADQDAELLLLQRPPPMSPADDALRLRLVELRRSQRKNATVDAVYACAVRQLLLAGVPMAGRTSPDDGREHAPVLLGIHGVGASKMIEAYVSAAVDGMSAKSKMSDDALVRVAKAQLAHSYHAGMMVGYYVRAVAFRYRLDCQLGTVPQDIETNDVGNLPPIQAVVRKLTQGTKADRHERMFTAYVERCQKVAASADALDAEMSVIVRELMLRQTGALFGDVSRLHLEFQDSYGAAFLAAQDDATKAAVAARVKTDVSSQRLESSTLRVARLRHLVREAAALGALLRDVEAYVRSYGLLL